MNANDLLKECKGLTESDTEEIQLRAKTQLKEVINK